MDRFTKYLKPPHFERENEQRTAEIAYFLLLVLLCAATLVAIVTIALQYKGAFYIASSTLLVILGCLWLVRKRHLMLVSHLIPLTLVAATTLILIIDRQRVHDYTILLFPLAILFSGLLIGRKAPIIFTGFISACLVGVYLAETRQWIAPASYNPTYFSDIILVSIYLLMTGFLVYVAVNIITNNLEQLQTLNTRLQQSETSYRLLFEEAPDAIFITDEQGLICMINAGVSTMLGYAEQDLLGKRPQDLVAPHDLERQAPTPLEMLRKGHTFRHERNLLHKDGSEVHAYTSSKALPDGRFQFLATDLTERIQAEQSIHNLNLELEKRVRQRTAELEAINKELESFSYSVSHDLRAPLRAITGFSQIIVEDFGQDLNEEGQALLARVMHSAQQMNELIESLLSFSRLTRSELIPVEVDLSAMALNITDEMQLNQPERRVTVTIEPGMRAYADHHLIQNVLVNLLGNAWKYSATTEQAQISFTTRTVESERVYKIEDNGVGFDMQYADNLFVPFQRLHSATEFPGHGVGLASVQRIIHRHGGRIWAKSQPGEGATFYFTIGINL